MPGTREHRRSGRHGLEHRVLAAVALFAICASLAAGLWAGSCGPAATAPMAPAGQTALALAAGQALPGPACELRAAPPRPVIALASVFQALPAPALADLGGPPPLTARTAPRESIPTSRVIRPLQHPPNLVD
jgi:hypothetical protein